VVRAQYVNDPPRVTGHVVYRAVVDKADFPDDLQVERGQHLGRPQLPPGALPAARRRAIQRGGHLPQPPGKEEWGVTEGSKEEVQSYFQGICPKARQLIDLPKSWKRWATADREPIGNGPSAAPRCWAMPPTPPRSTWRRAPAWRWKTR
jgi:hypothetical protein